MNSRHFWLAMVGLSLSASPVPAFTRYADVNNPNPVSPYSSWATAATNIQDAIDPPDTGGSFMVLVTNGIYQTGGASNNGSNRVTVPVGITVRSVNGPAVTV